LRRPDIHSPDQFGGLGHPLQQPQLKNDFRPAQGTNGSNPLAPPQTAVKCQ
jgi:hypothetical protein